LERSNLKLLQDRARGFLGLWAQVTDLRFYFLWRRGFAYGLHVYHSRGRDVGPDGVRRRCVLTFVARYLAEWKGRLEITPSLLRVRGEGG
jgi:hypothetical protein